MFSVFIPGEPAPQGSKKHVGGGILVESSKKLAPWRSDVRAACINPDGQPKARFDGPVMMHLGFILRRPASAPKRRTPPASKRPDIDKLARGVLDAVGSAGVWKDDSQVIMLTATKRIAEIGETPGCHIMIDQHKAH